MRTSSEDRLTKAALRFASKYRVALSVERQDRIVEALDVALIHPDRSAERRLWLRIAAYHRNRNGAATPVTSRGRMNAAIRFLAAYRLAPDAVLNGRQAERIIVEWDRAAKRALRSPDAPVWRYEWWIDSRKRFRVTLSVAADGSATVGYLDCG